MKIPKLMLINAESRRIIDGMESGITISLRDLYGYLNWNYDFLKKKYLRTLLFCISEAIEGPIIEEYAFSFSYSNSNNEDVMMNISHTGNKKQGATFRSYGNADITPNKMRYNRVMPPFFRGCPEEEANHPWLKTPLKMAIGNVNSKHIVLDLKVNWSKVSWYVPYQDENNDIKDDEAISLGVDSVPTTEPPNPDSECINFNLVDEMVESQMNDEFWVLNNTIQLKEGLRWHLIGGLVCGYVAECAENGGIELMEMELKLVVLCVGSGMNLDTNGSLCDCRMNLSGSLYVVKAAAELKLE
ncbi:hypothetical protein C5167_000413 [Papaver somniferum]|uniref:HORMA domain-containing protein n=1 Tax=Papaver somniferum TaxID=3469 RepID=A0A4Y7KWR1_PAPSO|nr:hypothetical protein C5167_000413 [Papaver somniferum]